MVGLLELHRYSEALPLVIYILYPWNCCRFIKCPNYSDRKQGVELGTILVLPSSFRLFTCQDGIVEGPYGFAKE